LLVEVDCRGVTGSGLLRQASFKGVREDKPAEEVVKEMPKQNTQDLKPTAAAGRGAARSKVQSKAAVSPPPPPTKANWKKGPDFSGVTLTNPDRVYWADVGITKQRLAEYYTEIWDWIAPHLLDRPLSLVRCPEGTKTECFFQK